MLVGAELQEAGAEQLTGGEIKGCGALVIEPGVDQLLGITISEGLEWKGERSRGMEDLEQLAAVEREGGAKGGMALDQGGEGVLEGLAIELTAQAPQQWHVVGGEVRFELMEEPETGLGEGGGKGVAAVGPGAAERFGGGDG